MKKLIVLVAAGALLTGCGEKLQEAKEAANAMQQLAEAGEKMAETQGEAEEFLKERRAKGDTVAMPADQLKTFLPTAIDGYKPKEEPSIQQTAFGEYTFSVAEQEWVSTSSADTNNPATIKVSLTDWGGSEGAWAMQSLAFAFNVKTENAQERSGTIDMGLPHTSGMEKFEKESKNSSLMAVTRYRYLINLEAHNQTDDQSPLLKSIAVATAEKFSDK
ncbi:MAG TPA: hypothetical protein VNA88_01800 [Candidatus Kapabacteria bacterium]|nr:hypothetical protein [Candidatus Kapabacteria bacterium]